MSPIPIPKPRLVPEREEELLRLLSRGFEANRWRADFEEWKAKRIWAERHQKRLVATLEERVLKGIPLEGLRVLDLGSGRGGLSVVLTLGGARVTAVDLRRRNCRGLAIRADRYDLTIPTAVAVGEHLPFASGSFDLVVCKDVTEHCREPDRVLAEVARVLAPGGRAYVTFINRLAWIDPHYKLPGINWMPRRAAERIIGWSGRAKPSIRDLQRLSDMHYYTLGAARRAARRAGLRYRDLTLEQMKTRGAGWWRQVAHRNASVGAATLEAVLSRT